MSQFGEVEFDTRRPIPCDKGALLQGTGNRGHVAFGYRNNAIWFGGVYDKDTNSIVINQLFWPGVDAEREGNNYHGLPSDRGVTHRSRRCCKEGSN